MTRSDLRLPLARFTVTLLLLGAAGCTDLGNTADVEVQRTDAMNSVLWVQTAAEYRALCKQTFRAATLALDAALADPAASAAIEQTGEFAALPPAIVCDLDETMLDNSAYNARLLLDGGKYELATWNDWVEEERALAVPGAKEFLEACTDKGVAIFYVTNRDKDVEGATRDNLRKLGYPIDESDRGAEEPDRLYTRSEYDEIGSEKTERRSKVAATHRILLMVGDDLGDFLPYARNLKLEDREARVEQHAERWGTRWFVLPNPIYGSWTKKLEGRQRAKLRR